MAKCGECKWLTGAKKTSIGVECMHPENQKKWNEKEHQRIAKGVFYPAVVARYKYTYTKACTKFEPKWRTQEMTDIVKEPEHYKQGEFETIDEMIIVFGEEATATYCKIAAWKYRARANFKENFEQDMRKADTYLRFAQQLEQHKLLKGE